MWTRLNSSLPERYQLLRYREAHASRSPFSLTAAAFAALSLLGSFFPGRGAVIRIVIAPAATRIKPAAKNGLILPHILFMYIEVRVLTTGAQPKTIGMT